MATDDTRSYRDLLDAAYVRGWDDGSFAAPFEPQDGVQCAASVCQGRTPADFARSLWHPRPGEPPAGLALNAPHWYAHGFAGALAHAGRRVGSGSPEEQPSPRVG
jgi:hypothetical protein